eukprot:gene22833-30005_t
MAYILLYKLTLPDICCFTFIFLIAHLAHLQVFAFLPLRSYGLRFVVQADFVVPSSREAVDSDSAWNQMLRDQLPGLFRKLMGYPDKELVCSTDASAQSS